MAFVDNLAYSLLSLSFAGFLILYTLSSLYLVYRRGKKNFFEYLDSAAIPLALIGVYMFVTGLWGQFTWPLPGSYNILFYDPLLSFGILLVAFAIAIRTKAKLEYVGFLGLMMGVVAIAYGFEGYKIGLTSAPLALFGMYLAYGVAGIFSYPVSLIVDRRLPGLKKRSGISLNVIVIVLFLLLILLASALSAYVGVSAISAHLITAP